MAFPGGGLSSPRSDLFLFDRTTLRGDILVHDGPSRLEYKEYAVFRPRDAFRPESAQSDGALPTHGGHVCHNIGHGASSSEEHFDLAMRKGHGLNSHGNFVKLQNLTDPTLEGRVRHIVCRRHVRSEDGSQDGLSITGEDFDLLDLHPATLQYVRRITTESMFWDRKHEKLSLIISFSSEPRAPFDFLSMTFSIPDRLTTVLIRQSYDPFLHGVDDVDEYEKRMEACRSHWAHPLVTPVVLLQVQFARTEEAVARNNIEVNTLEQEIGTMAGFEAYERRDRRKSSFTTKGGVMAPLPPKKTTQLMKAAHDALKKTIQLLDTIRWVERAVQILLDAGDEIGDIIFDADDNFASPDITVPLSPRRRAFSGLSRERIRNDPMASHWHEIRQYLEGLLQLCKSLGMDRHMLEVRCKAQIDIIYSKMAQEDNNLNARMAVASTRDSSSMKALAVITAIFLPGDFIGTFFGMSMFDWQDIGQGQDGDSIDGKHPIVTSRFWVYWSVTVPLTITVLCLWRAWWVAQDRHFRKHLSRDLSEERFWTDDGQPRQLERGFLHDFFYLSVRRDERGHGWGAGNLSATTSFSKSSDDGWDKIGRGTRITGAKNVQTEHSENPRGSTTFRLRQIGFADVEKPGPSRTYV